VPQGVCGTVPPVPLLRHALHLGIDVVGGVGVGVWEGTGCRCRVLDKRMGPAQERGNCQLSASVWEGRVARENSKGRCVEGVVVGNDASRESRGSGKGESA
jgi:hypothetical protein